MSLGISQQTRQTAYELFTPNNSGQRLRPTYYRGCWHVVSRCFFCRYRHFRFFPAKRGLQPEGRHPSRGVAASGLRPLCNIPHCCLSVPVWPVTLSGRLPVDALVSHYLTNKLIGREPIPDQKIFPTPTMRKRLISSIRRRFQRLSQSPGQVAHVLLTRSPLINLASFDSPFD